MLLSHSGSRGVGFKIASIYIEAVIAAQDELVEVIGRFTPRIVRMADEAGEY